MKPAIRIIDTHDSRDIERTTLDRRGVLRIAGDATPVDVFVLDLTRDGCGIRGTAPVEPGDRVEIGIANLGRIPATILWRGDNGFGCMFDHPLPAGSVTAALGPCNIMPFPLDTATAPAPVNTKLSPRARLIIIFGSGILSWTAIGALIAALL